MQKLREKKYLRKSLSVFMITSLLLGAFPWTVSANDETLEETSEQISEQSEKEQPEESENIEESGGETEEETEEANEKSVVETGDAESNSTIVNEANNSEVGVQASSSDLEDSEENEQDDGSENVQEEDEQESATSTLKDAQESVDDVLEDVGATGTSSESSASTSSVNVTGTSTLDAENMATSSAKTGGNAASSSDDVAIDTGDAHAFLTLLNKFNTTEINSEGVIQLLNTGDFVGDLRANLSGEGSASTQELSELTLENINQANLSNDVAVLAETGGNNACSENGDANIQTGDAKAGANIVNFGNNTFIESKYAVLSANVLGDFIGDIVLPGKDFFREAGAKIFENFVMKNKKEADVEVVSHVSAGSGENTTESGDVETGASQSSSVISNDVNTTAVGGSPKVNLAFNIFGGFEGGIFSLPDGIRVDHNDTGFVIRNEESKNQEVQGNGSDSEAVESHSQKTSSSTVMSTTTLVNRTNATVEAKTGNNTACGSKGASVETGNAMSGLVVLGLYNATFYGKNLLYGAVNVFGDIKGNISFGQPDLWVGGQADVDTTSQGALPGSVVKYTYTLYNRGDADATQVRFSEDLGQHLSFRDSEDGVLNESKKVAWNIPEIPAGEAVSVSYTVDVSDTIPYGKTYVTNTSHIRAHEPDANESDNTEELSVPLYRYDDRGGRGGPEGLATPVASDEEETEVRVEKPDITIEKTSDAVGTTTASSSVTYTILVENDGGKAYRAFVEDVLMYEDGSKVYSQDWQLGVIQPDEEITLEYTIFFDGRTKAGEYTNTASIQYRLTEANGSETQHHQTESVVNFVNEENEFDQVLEDIQTALLEGRSLAREIDQSLAASQEKEPSENVSGVVSTTEKEEEAVSLASSDEYESDSVQGSVLGRVAEASEGGSNKNAVSSSVFPWNGWGWSFFIVVLLSLFLRRIWKYV